MNVKPRIKTEHLMVHTSRQVKRRIVIESRRCGLSISSLLNTWIIEKLGKKER